MTPAVPQARISSERTRTFSARTDRPDLRLGLRLPTAPATPVVLPSEPRPEPSSRHLVPDVVLAGVTHAGATRLSRALARHPEVKLPVHQRVDHYSPLRFGQPIEATLADYDRHFATWRGQRYRLERSPVYFDGGQQLVDALCRDLPGLRVVLLLRNPVDRLWTGYRDKVARGRVPRAMTYETYVERCLALRANDADRFEGNRYFRTLSSGLYAEHVGRWLDAFGRRVKVIFAEDLDVAPRRTVEELFTWLDLDPGQSGSSAEGRSSAMTVDGSDGSSAAWLESFSEEHRRPWAALGALPGPGDLVRRVTRPRVPRQSDRLRQRLERFYAQSNHDLATRLTGLGYRDLPPWLADAM